MNWTPEQLKTVRAMVADRKNSAEVAAAFGVSQKRIRKLVLDHGLGPWIKGRELDRRPAPADFDEHKGETIVQLCERYRAGVETVQRWRREAGVMPHKGRPRGPEGVPGDFLAVQDGKTVVQIARHYKRARRTVERWIKASGVERKSGPAPTPKPTPRKRDLGFNRQLAPTSGYYERDMSAAGQAADYLRPDYVPVYRCNDRGEQKPDGSHFRCGRLVLTAAEIVDRASEVKRGGLVWRKRHETEQGIMSARGLWQAGICTACEWR